MINGLHRIKTAVWYRLFFKRIGKGSLIRNPILICNPEFIEIGEGVIIRDGARLEVVKDGVTQEPTLRIGSNTNIEQNVHIVCHSSVIIGDNVSITANCAIVDTTHPYHNVQLLAKVGSRVSTEPSFVKIGDGAFIGYGTIIMPNVHIGEGAIIGAHSLINRHVEPYTVACGSPAKTIKVYDPATREWVKIRREPV